MKPETYSSKASRGAFFFYLVLFVAWVVGLWWAGEPMWYLAFFPFYGFGLILLVKTEKYKLQRNELFVKGLMEHKHIPFEEIRSVELVEQPQWKSLITGFPKQSLKVRYQKYEEVWLHARNPQELKQALEQRLQS